MGYREDRINAVRFCSLLPLRSIPAACIALMGMQEDAFPRQNNQSSLNLMTGRNDVNYCPSPSDYDRYLFLEALHSAQKNLLLSCQGFGQKDGKEVRPSLIVEELFSYLDTFYIAQGKKASDACIFKHPFDAFDAGYFSKGSAFANFSTHDYSASLALCHPEKSAPHRLVQAFTFAAPQLSQILENGSQIDMRDLARAVRDPIKFHLNQTLEIFLETEEARKVKTEEEITVSPLDKYRMMQLAPKLPIDAILQRAERQGMLPFGLFKTVAAKRMKMDALEISSCLENLSIDPSGGFSD